MSIELKNIKKTYSNNVTVLDDLNLVIKDKSFTVLVGPSGCGKTTTLRLISGLESADEGTISIEGRDVTDVDPSDRNIAMVFQNYAIYPHMTVRSNIEFGLKNYKISKENIKKRVDYVLEKVGLTEYADRMPNQISGGQRQRVALARAISKSPQAFLMDEPLSNLDAKLRGQMRSELIQLHHDLQCTFVYVTHDQTEAMTMGTDIVIMLAGKIMQSGTPREIYDDPHNVFVARFIGDPGMNVLQFEDKSFVAFRPREAEIGQKNGTLNFTGKILTREFLGSEYMYTIDIGCGNIVVKWKKEVELDVDTEIELYVELEDLYFFDENQERTGPKALSKVVSVYNEDE